MFARKIRFITFILLAMTFSVNSNAVIQVSKDPYVGEAIYSEKSIDLRVKTAGGYLDIERYYGRVPETAPGSRKYGWRWNRRWENLRIVDESDVPGTLSRGGFQYTLVEGFNAESGEQPVYYYEHLKNKKIVKDDDGYTWSDRNGDWIKFNQSGKVTSYGDRFDNDFTLLHDSDDGSILQVQDRYENILITFTYQYGVISEITDYSGRKVQYIWEQGLLKNVIDEQGGAWEYTYQLIDPGEHSRHEHFIETVTDPEGQTHTLDHAIISGGEIKQCYSSEGEKPKLVEKTDPATGVKSWELKTTPGSGNISCHVIVSPAQVMLRNMIDAEGVKYSYGYTYINKQYSLTTKSSEGINITRTTGSNGTPVLVVENGQVTYEKLEGNDKEAISNAGGNQTLNTLDQWKQITKTVHPDGTIEQWEYHPSYDVLTKYTDKRGVITLNEYDDKAQLIRTTKAYGLPEAQITEYTYNEQGLVEKTTYVGDENTTTAEKNSKYDNFGNEIEFVDAEGNKTEYLEYDVLGNYHKMKDAKGNLWLYEYDLAGNLTKATTPMGFVTDYVYDKNSNMVSETLPGKTPKEFGYNKRNQLNKVTINNSVTGEQEITRINLRADGKVLTVTDAEGHIQSFDYDGQGKLIQTYDALENTIKYEYDYEDVTGGQKPSAIVYPTYREEYTYDVMGRVKSTTLVDGENSYTTNYSYDENGNLVTFIDAKGNVTKSTYDALNRLSSVEDAMGGLTKYEYDLRDNLLAVIDPKLSTTRYQYNKSNQKKLETKPLGQTLAYSFNFLTQLETYTDSLGQVTKYGYDNDGRQTIVEYYVNAQITTAEKTIIFNYDNAGWLTGYDDGQNSAVYTYDDAGRLLSESTNFGSFSKTLNYTYYKNSKRHTYTNSDDLTYTYEYDQANRFNNLTLPSNARISVNEFQSRVPTKVTYPGGTQVDRTLNRLNQLKNMGVLDVAKNSILGHEYTYDEVGNIETQKTHFDSFNYDYNDLYRLEGAIGEKSQEDYTYDAVGNRLTSNQSNQSNQSWEYNANHQLTNIGDSGYLYDDNGSMTQRTFNNVTQKLTYSIDGRLQQVSNLIPSDIEGEEPIEAIIAIYTYDPFGRRLSKTVSGTTTYFLYSAQGLMAEYDEQGNAIRNYNYWPGAHWGSNPLYLEQVTDGKSEHYFYHNDHLGTPQALSDSQGRVVWRAEFSAFGEVASEINEVENPLRFPGQYEDKETGFYYNYFRYYDPSLGRYIQSDPIGLNGGLNSYGYAYQNPLFYIDSYGLFFCLTSGQIAGISGAIGGAVTGGLSTGTPFGALAGAAIGGVANYASHKLGGDENKNIGTGIGGVAGGLGNLKRGFTGAGVLGGFVGGGVGGAFGGSSGSAAIGGAFGGFVGGAFDSTSRTKTIGGNMLKGARSGFLGGAAQDISSQLMKDFLKCKENKDLMCEA